MPQATPAKILRVHLSESDQYQGKSLADAIVAKCREMHLAGATVLRGMEGYGETAEIEKRPLVVIVVDNAPNIERLKSSLEAMLDTGMIAVSDVEMIRIVK